jgi:molecular chaperone GrpE
MGKHKRGHSSNNKEEKPTQEEIKEETQNSEEDELAKCQEELEAQKDKYLRAVADFENYKKRLEKEKQNALIYANESFAKDLLTVLDTFENALKSIDSIEENSEAVEKIKEGMHLTYEQLLSILKKHGVEEVECEGEFNPEVHQAVTQMESDKHNSGDIVQVLQKGYKLKDRLLRASMVATCK